MSSAAALARILDLEGDLCASRQAARATENALASAEARARAIEEFRASETTRADRSDAELRTLKASLIRLEQRKAAATMRSKAQKITRK